MSSETRVADPVCGMLILPARAAGTRMHRDVTYHLCSVGCLRKFDADAEAYVAASRVEGFRTWVANDPDHFDLPPNLNTDSRDSHTS